MSRKIPADAFEYYASLGQERSYERVAERYGVTKRAVSKCAQREEWTQRLAKIEREARERSDEKMGEVLDEMRGRHMRTLKAMNARALSALKQHPLNSGMEAVRAAEMVIKLERLIVGEPTERTASVEEVTRREVQSLLTVEDDEDDDEADDEDGEEARP